MKLDQSNKPKPCNACKALGHQCNDCWRAMILARAAELENRVSSTFEAKPDPVVSKPLFMEDGA